MTIHVTREDIQQGERRNGRSCAIAVACRRSGLKGVVATTRGIFVDVAEDNIDGLPSFYKAIDIDEATHDFMVAFDKGLPVEPFSIDLKGVSVPVPEEQLVCA